MESKPTKKPRKYIEVPTEMPKCRKCGAECEKVQLAAIHDVAEGEVCAEIRCTNGHINLQFLRPTQEAIEYGRKLKKWYGR